MDISLIIPVLNERENIAQLYAELVGVLADEGLAEYEIIFVDDGSTDGTGAVLEQLHAADLRVRVIQFRRNFGKSAALAAAFKRVRGEIVFTLDGDLQDNPSEIPHFLARLEEGYDLVSGWKYPRLDPITKTFPSWVWNRMMQLSTGVKLHDFNCSYKAYRREVTQEIVLYGELHRYVPILAHHKGYRVAEIQVAHRPRLHGKSKFGMGRFARGAFDLLTVLFLGQYRWRPLHLFGWLGAGAFALGVLVNAYLAFLWFAGLGPIGNRPLLTLGVLLMTIGVQFFSIGLLAEMFVQTQARDFVTYSIRRILE